MRKKADNEFNDHGCNSLKKPCNTSSKKDKKWNYIIAIIIISLITWIIIVEIFGPDREPCGCNNNEYNENLTPLTVEPSISNSTTWYIKYPDEYSNNGTIPEHPEWVLNATSSSVVILFVHSGTCEPCIKQEADIKDILSEHGGNISYFDIRTDDALQTNKMSDVFDIYYDPAHPHAIPLTVFLYEDGGGVEWFSYAGYSGKEIILEYVQNATMRMK